MIRRCNSDSSAAHESQASQHPSQSPFCSPPTKPTASVIVTDLITCGPSSSSILYPLCVSAKRRLVELMLKSSGRFSQADDENLSAEISSYLCHQPSSSEADDAAVFWKSHALQYPNLNRVAKRYLSMSATSVPVECMFSTTGLIINNKRMSLAPHKLNYCTFIHDNSTFGSE